MIIRLIDHLGFEGYILQRFPPGKWLGLNVILWGIATASTAAVNSYNGLLVCRICVGVFEAAMSPCLMLITGEDSMIPIIVKKVVLS
jgi:MFS family permease